MYYIQLILISIYYLVGAYLLFYSFYWCYLSVLSTLFSPTPNSKKVLDKWQMEKLLILFPAYQPNFQLVEAVKAAKGIDCDDSKVEILVLLQHDTYDIKRLLNNLGVSIIEKSFKDVKGNPYHEALRFCAQEAIKRDASHILLLDKDNIASPGFIQNIKLYGDITADVWQGKRTAINSETKAAVYDGISEKLNDALLREAKQVQGLPPELSGSALLFKTDAFNIATHHLDARAPGMDKNLLIQLLLSNKRISYVPTAQVSEEKTDDNEVIKKQRMRWFGNQYFNAFYWGKALLLKGKMATVDYAITLYRPPRSIQMVILPLLACLEFIININHIFTLSTILTFIGILVFLVKEGIWREAFKIAFTLPKMALDNLKSALKGSAKKQQGKFISTERSATSRKDAA